MDRYYQLLKLPLIPQLLSNNPKRIIRTKRVSLRFSSHQLKNKKIWTTNKLKERKRTSLTRQWRKITRKIRLTPITSKTSPFRAPLNIAYIFYLYYLGLHLNDSNHQWSVTRGTLPFPWENWSSRNQSRRSYLAHLQPGFIWSSDERCKSTR